MATSGRGAAAQPYQVWCGDSSLSGRVPPPGEPVKVWRTVETKDDDPAFLGLHVLISFACALGESAPPFMGSPTTEGQPYLFHRQLTTDN